jgi:hypothetical protein
MDTESRSHPDDRQMLARVCAVADLAARDGVASSYLSDAAIDEQLDTVN